MKINKVLKSINRTNNFIYLTLALVTLLISASLIQVLQGHIIAYLLQSIIVFTFIVCFMSLHCDRKGGHFLLGIVVVWLGAAAIKHALYINNMDVFMLALIFVFFFSLFKALVKQILFSGEIDTNKLVGSMALFLLLGLMWAIAYLIVLEFDPTSFSGLQAMAWEENFSNSAYFSFVTLTTLGYGDISPVTPIAKTLVYLESIVGIFYMAVVVSSLVSSNFERRAHKK
ncbi:potassium channel family protein [Photobacterium aphoticum]|uniref:Transporter n=1 Tax=Photobacterium aphoticum TaxID=754436 RepID=A0A0J1JEW2_9GAMM|nr:potassium channel family protein [Photobacterium aphoticum]KLV00182.1 transporter [Photobacterium aphoticum]PSU55502.1 two pore domain potassium channel family protein [Photobacterium aphoticum]